MTYISPNLLAQLQPRNDTNSNTSSNIVTNLFSNTVSDTSTVQEPNTEPQNKGYLEYPKNIFNKNHNSVMNFRAISSNNSDTSAYTQLRLSFLNESEDNNTQTNTQKSKNIEACIYLPVPALEDTAAHDVGSTKMDLASEAIASGVDVLSTFENGGAAAAAGQLAKEGKQFLGTIVSAARRDAVNATQYQNLSKNSTVNVDIQTSSYKGTDLRVLTVVYTFIPKNVTELKQLEEIYKTFYLISHPDRPDKQLIPETPQDVVLSPNSLTKALKSPPVWFIEELPTVSKKHNYMPRYKMGPASLERVHMNRTPDDIQHTFKDSGDPYKIVLTLTFKELIPLDQQLIRAQWTDTSSEVSG